MSRGPNNPEQRPVSGREDAPTEAYLYLECDCNDPDHLVRFFRDDDPDWATTTISVQMSHYLPWWRRLVVAAQFICGHHAKCHWVDALIDDRQRHQLLAFLADGAERVHAQADGEGPVLNKKGASC